MNSNYWIKRLKMQPHPEGGYYCEYYRSKGVIPENALPLGFKGERNFCTSIYYLLHNTDFSAIHKLRSDEIWHYYTGDTAVLLYMLYPNGIMHSVGLGSNADIGELFQYVIPAGVWFCAALEHYHSFALMGCTVAPGFNFDDYEIGQKHTLKLLFPQHAELIERFAIR